MFWWAAASEGRLRVGPYREKLWPRSWKCCPRPSFFPAVSWLNNKGVTQILDKERCIKEQNYFELLYVKQFKFSKSVFSVWNFVQKQVLSLVANHSISDFSTVNCAAYSEEIRQVYSTRLKSEYPATSHDFFAFHWIRIATIVICLVLQSTPTHVMLLDKALQVSHSRV